MRTLLFMICLIPGLALAQSSGIQNVSPDELAIQSGMLKLEQGWNAASGKIFAEPFAPDCDYVVINGMKIKGHDTIEKAHQQIFDTVYKGSKIKLKMEGVRFLKPDVAVAHASAVRDNLDGSKDHARMTVVWQKQNGKWMIEAFQNTAIVQPAGVAK